MSLGYIFVCADDGEVYKTDLVQCDGYDISFEEDDDDEFWLRIPPGGMPQERLKTGDDVMALVRRDGLPIRRVDFQCVLHHISHAKTIAFYDITWEQGKAFPRRLLPEQLKPVTKKHEGTYCCYTKQHRDKLDKAK